MTYESQVECESKVAEGVKFTVRVLNKIQRAKRDLPLLEVHGQITDIVQQIGKITDHQGEIQDIRDGAKDRALTPEEESKIKAIQDRHGYSRDMIELAKLDHKYGHLINIHQKPAFILAGLMTISGLTIGGKPITNAQQLIEHGHDDLIDEVYIECVKASGLAQEQQKNSSSSSDSQEAAPVGENSTTATAA